MNTDRARANIPESARPLRLEWRRAGELTPNPRTGKFEDVTRRIGNSVPPLFMRAIARHVRKLLTI